MKKTALTLFIAFAALSVQAQIKYGFKTGLNFARIIGQSEADDGGNGLETWKNNTGFHIGMTFSHKFTDRFGLRGEFLYSKRGAKYTYDGQSFRYFKHTSGQALTYGSARYLINVTNSYIDIPVIAFFRLGDVEFGAGGYAGLLVQSVGEGSLRYSGKTSPLNNDIYVWQNPSDKDLSFNLNYNYRKDNPGEGTGDDSETPLNVNVDGLLSENPQTLGAYYDYSTDNGKLYNAFDYGLVGSASYYISNALYLNLRVQYGLADITNNKVDLYRARLSEKGELLYSKDKDQNFAIQVSIGFSF